MISETYKAMLGGKSVIRELSEYATARGKEIGYDNVFDFSLGNPSVPVPGAYNGRLISLIREGDPMLVHGYSPSLGIPAVREKIAASLNERFGMHYAMDDIFMTSGAAGALAEVAAARGQTLSQLALQWVLRRPTVTSALIGASRPEQILENIAALSFPALTQEELAEIDAAVGL